MNLGLDLFIFDAHMGEFCCCLGDGVTVFVHQCLIMLSLLLDSLWTIEVCFWPFWPSPRVLNISSKSAANPRFDFRSWRQVYLYFPKMDIGPYTSQAPDLVLRAEASVDIMCEWAIGLFQYLPMIPWSKDGLWLSAWCFGTCFSMFFHMMGNFIIPTDFHSIIFQRG
jgi:hypothetical protein